ncbi:MAG: tRNA 4-thiouridine(8) synthase ThiI [Clostridiales bacterium]|jgi:thiamine biosynthesis protein ThiI|nr:tRNA 4-thiouridine(8) synthase ThiI [Clostridiales bacterium]
MKEALLVKYGEICLRGDNRSIYEKQLLRQVRRRLSGFDGIHVIKENGRFLIESDDDDFDFSLAIPLVVKVLGVIGVSPCIKADCKDIANLRVQGLEYMKKRCHSLPSFTFKVETRRADKRYSIHSYEVSAAVGEAVIDGMQNASVDVHNPDVVLHIEIRESAYIYAMTEKAFGGLPYATSGRGILLLSGGIDSPTAGFLMAKRGVDITAVYFHSPPFTSERAKEKVLDLAKVLRSFTQYIKVFVVPFTDIQLKLKESVPPAKLTILLKRQMLKAAELIAANESCQCLITGDSIGQVASQTMHGIAAVQSAASIPIIRPLAGMDKQDIIDIARKIETYEISIRPYEDCCTLFSASHPETKPKASIIEAVERRVEGLEELIHKAVAEAEAFEFS